MISKINVLELSKCNEKIKIYRVDEELNFSEFKEVLENINNNYITDNTDKLIELELELLNKFKVINQNHNNNVMIVDKNIDNYKRLSYDTEKIFSDLI